MDITGDCIVRKHFDDKHIHFNINVFSENLKLGLKFLFFK